MRALTHALGAGILVLISAPAHAAEPVGHSMQVSLRGPIAIVEVTRTFRPGSRDQHATEAVIDLALPENAALMDVQIAGSPRATAADRIPVEGGGGRYLAAATSRGVTPAAVPFDDSAQLRLRVVVPPETSAPPVQVRYRLAVPLTPSGGRLKLRMPPAIDDAPLPVAVTVRAEAAAGHAIEDISVAGVTSTCPARARRCEARGTGGPRSGWELSYALRRPAAPVPAAHELLGVAALGGGLLAATVEHRAAGQLELPERVLLVIDRSRSVGLSGLNAERDVARRILERLPPHVRFDALFFARDVLRLFTAPRTATRQALSLIDDAMVPLHMANGTDLPAALRETSKLLEREAGLFGPRVLVVLITDGALPDGQNAAALRGTLHAPAGVEMQVMALSVRAAGEDPVPAPVRRALQSVVTPTGGVERELDARDLAASVDDAVAALARGGDAVDVRVRSTAGDDLPWSDLLPPGGAATRTMQLARMRPGRLRLEAHAAGRALVTALEPAAADEKALRALAAPAPAGLWLAAPTQGPVALLEPVRRPGATPLPEPRGTLERSVARDALALAYLPRARACYQTRPTATPAERDLAGRVRLAIDVNRGEVTRTSVEFSSLRSAPVERCLMEAAWSVEMPRAYHNDQWITAVLNLVFRQRPAEETRTPGAGVGPQIDVILEELHRSEQLREGRAPGSDGGPDAGADAGAPRGPSGAL